MGATIEFHNATVGPIHGKEVKSRDNRGIPSVSSVAHSSGELRSALASALARLCLAQLEVAEVEADGDVDEGKVEFQPEDGTTVPLVPLPEPLPPAAALYAELAKYDRVAQ